MGEPFRGCGAVIWGSCSPPQSCLKCIFGANHSDVASSICKPELAMQRWVMKPEDKLCQRRFFLPRLSLFATSCICFAPSHPNGFRRHCCSSCSSAWSLGTAKVGPGGPAGRCPKATEAGGGAWSWYGHRQRSLNSCPWDGGTDVGQRQWWHPPSVSPKRGHLAPKQDAQLLWGMLSPKGRCMCPSQAGALGNLSVLMRAAFPEWWGWGCSQLASRPHCCRLIPKAPAAGVG